MRGKWCAALAALTLTTLATGPVAAQYGARAEVESPPAAGSDQDPTAAATVVGARDRARELETVDDLLLEVPAARVRRSGGLGEHADVALRGAGAEHTLVLLD